VESGLAKDVRAARRRTRALAIIQGVYFTATGIWPLLHYRSFEEVTGPKRDDWLVKTVGLMISCIGATLLMSAKNQRPSAESKFLALSTAIALCGIDTYFSATGRISKIYLLDAAAEVVLAAAWANERHLEAN
jgi:energy-converting hydrogenase Eha subunit E